MRFRFILAPLSSAVGVIAQAVPNQVGNFAHTVPRKVGNFAQTVPSSVGNGDGPSNQFVRARSCRCAVLLTILFGGIVLGFIALQTPKVKPGETKVEIPDDEFPSSSTTPMAVYCIAGRPVGFQKKYVDASTQKSPLIIFANGERKKRPRPEGPSGDDQVPSSDEDQKPLSKDMTEPDSCSSETSSKKSESSDEKIVVKDEVIYECMRKSPTSSLEEPVRCLCRNAHTKDQEEVCVKTTKRMSKRRKKASQATSAGPPSETGSIRDTRSPRDRRRSRTSDNPRLSRGGQLGSDNSSRSRQRAKKKTKK